MKITEEQFERIKHCFPGQRGNVKMSNLEFLNAILHVAENGCKRRGLPREFGNRHTVYRRMSRRSKSGVPHPVFTGLQVLQTVKVKVEHVSLDKHRYKGSSRCRGRCKKFGPQSVGQSRGGRNTKIHLVASNDRTASGFILSPGNGHDAPRGRELLKNINLPKGAPLPADRAYGDNQTREPAVKLELIPVIPPKSTRKQPWKYDSDLYRKRNGVEGLFRRIKRFRSVFTRYDKLDIIYTGFLLLAFIYDALFCVNTP